MKKFLPQTGDTQVICMEKPTGGFIDWCIGVAASAISRHPKPDETKPDPTAIPIRFKRFAA
jgi:hypothetical protein